MQILINAGGQGKRLYPLTKDIPKPMISILGKPMLQYLVEWAKDNKFTEIIIMSGYKSEKITEYFGDGKKFGIKIIHSIEEKPLDSGGAIRLASKHVKGTFAYISGDLACEVKFKPMLEFHKKNKAEITILLKHSSHPQDSDLLEIDQIGRVKRFISKHDNHENAGDFGNAGLCIIEPKILELMDKEAFTFETYIYPKILEKGLKMMGYITDELIQDLGTIDRLRDYKLYLQGRKK